MYVFAEREPKSLCSVVCLTLRSCVFQQKQQTKAHATLLGAVITTTETLIVAGVQLLVLSELFGRYCSSFALTEAVSVSQLICLSWLKSFRFFLKAYRELNDVNVIDQSI
jgi:glycerol-3-phosphate acyltransferase PlsY